MSPSNIVPDHKLANKSENIDAFDVCSRGIQKGVFDQDWPAALIQLLQTCISAAGDSAWRRHHYPGDHRELSRALADFYLSIFLMLIIPCLRWTPESSRTKVSSHKTQHYFMAWKIDNRTPQISTNLNSTSNI